MVLDGAADVNVVLGLVNLKQRCSTVACRTEGRSHHRCISPASERVPLVVGANEVQCSVVEETDAHPSLPLPMGLRTASFQWELQLNGRDQRAKTGALCPALLCALVAEPIWLPQERGCAGFALGCLLNRAVERDALRSNQYTVLRDHLGEEGAMRAVSLADVDTLPSALPDGCSTSLSNGFVGLGQRWTRRPRTWILRGRVACLGRCVDGLGAWRKSSASRSSRVGILTWNKRPCWPRMPRRGQRRSTFHEPQDGRFADHRCVG